MIFVLLLVFGIFTVLLQDQDEIIWGFLKVILLLYFAIATEQTLWETFRVEIQTFFNIPLLINSSLTQERATPMPP